MFLPLTSHNPVPSHTWNCQQIVDQRLKVLRIFRSKFVYVDPTDSLWTPAWGPNQGCSGGGWEKKGQEKSENEASKYWAAESEKKSEGSSKLKEGLCVTQARWCIEWTSSSSSCVSNPFFFCHIQSCYSLLLFSKHGGSRWKKYFCLRVHGWSSKVTRLHCWFWCPTDRNAPCTPCQTGNTAQDWQRPGPFRL